MKKFNPQVLKNRKYKKYSPIKRKIATRNGSMRINVVSGAAASISNKETTKTNKKI